jgi:hypothetical protein
MMPAPSFSSFPPSFGSFPDVEDNPSREASSSSSQRKGLKEKDEASDRKKKKRDRRETHADQSQTFSHERGHRNHNLKADNYSFDDERIKAEEMLRTAKQQDVPQLAFFSDRKGDPLNVQYGGIFSKEVPKYHLVGCA